MPAIDTNTSRNLVRVKEVKPKPKKRRAKRKTNVRVPDRHDPVVTGGGKQRMYANPGRPAAQKVFKEVADEAAKESAKKKAAAQETRTVVRRIDIKPVPSPDAKDSTRSPAQKRRDAEAARLAVRDSRLKFVTEQGRGSGTRALKEVLNRAVDAAGADRTTPSTGAGPTLVRVKRGKGGGVGFATVTPMARGVRLDDASAGGRFAKRAGLDAAELAVTTPSSLAHLAKTAATEPQKVPGMLAQPYKDFVKDPVGTFTERPVSTGLLVVPAARIPTRAAGRVARLTGKQTLERPAATLPGTALKVQRTGSRDILVRAYQSHKDKKNPNPVATKADVQKRVDEHYDFAKHQAMRAEAEARRATRKATKGRPKAERRADAEVAAAHMGDRARREMDEAFAREFGANARPSTGKAETIAAKASRDAADAVKDSAKVRVKTARSAVASALADAKMARAKTGRSSTLAALEGARRTAQAALTRAQAANNAARRGQSVAKGRAEVLSRNVGGGGKAGGYGIQLAAQAAEQSAKAVKDARAAVKRLDAEIAAERRRVEGVPPAEHDRLLKAIEDRDAAIGERATARTAAKRAEREHIDTKKAKAGATLVDAADAGRLFEHKADAGKVAERLNAQAAEQLRGGKRPVRVVYSDPPEGVPMVDARKAGSLEPVKHKPTAVVRRTDDRVPVEFTVRAVGDKWAVMPKAATERLHKQQVVGSSKATVAKGMRVSRQAFTQATLPLSAKWVAGQAVESPLRALVAGAGPLDILRTNRTVKAMNKKVPGSGDALLTRISGGQLGLTSPARDYATGKSLAQEFKDTPLEGTAAVATHVGGTLPLRAVRRGWREYTKVIFAANGVIEQTARKAMAGQAMKNSPFLERRINGLSDKAIQDAAKGLKGTEAQVELARAVDRMYGKYSRFSPEARSLMMHWTPFAPWYLNMVGFLTKTLPGDHPMQASLVASASVTTEEWRKENRLSLKDPDRLAGFLLGSYPTEPGRYSRVGHFLPFAPVDPAAAAASLALPQVITPLAGNIGFGVDFTGKKLRHPGGEEFNMGEKVTRGIVSAAEAQIPGVSKVGRLTGLTKKYVDKKDDIPTLRERLEAEVPFYPTRSSDGASATTGKRVRVKRVRVKRVRVKRQR